MKKRILLVDDEQGIRTVLRISLEDLGYEVHTAESGDEALKLFDSFTPAIVLTDIKMPGMDGIQVLEALKKRDPDTEVIMITGHGEMDLAVRSLKYRAADFIAKPISDEALRVALNRAEERIHIRQQLADHTENLERLVKEKTRQLMEAERMAAVGETVAGLSHAIKNIAGGLSGGVFVLEKGLDLDNRQYLQQGWEMIRGNVDRVRNLSLDLLHFAKPPQCQFRQHHPRTPLEAVVDLMRPQAKTHGIDLRVTLDEGLKPFNFDMEGIHRCLLNLVTNAMDACLEMEAVKKGLSIDVSAIKVKGWAVEYCVEDNCRGIETHEQEKIFQRFFSTKGTRGTGIGLMLTRRIVDLHKGEITVDSEKGKGARFVIRLPENPEDNSDTKEIE